MNLLQLAAKLMLLGASKGIAVAVFGQLFFMVRFVYEYRPFLLKTLLWGILLTLFVASGFADSADVPFRTAFFSPSSRRW